MQLDAATCQLYLVRHGATANNQAQPPRLQGCRSDPELSDMGQQQSRQAAELLRCLPLAAVYASPLLRAQQTGTALAEPHGLLVQQIEALTECDVGEWEGRSWVDIEREDPQRFQQFIADSAANPYAGGESLEQVRQRIVPVFDELQQRHAGQAIAVAAHNVVNRVYLAHLLGWPIARARSIPQSNCGVNLIEFRAGQGTVLTINGAFHLQGTAKLPAAAKHS